MNPLTVNPFANLRQSANPPYIRCESIRVSRTLANSRQPSPTLANPQQVTLSPGCRSVGLCRNSVGPLSGLCRVIVRPLSVDNCRPLSAFVGLCRPILTGTTRVSCRPLSACRDYVGRSVGRFVGPCRDSVGILCRSVEQGLKCPCRKQYRCPWVWDPMRSYWDPTGSRQ